MTDYISREAALKTLCKYCDPEPDGSISCDGCHPPCADYEDFKTIPAADVMPVVHGRWQGVSPMVDSMECSVCRYCIPSEEFKTPFCPWCGAKMDGGTE